MFLKTLQYEVNSKMLMIKNSVMAISQVLHETHQCKP